MVALVVLLLGIFKAINYLPDMLRGELFGITTSYWLMISIAIPIVHQTYVWLSWRLELHHQKLSKLLGSKAFPVYKLGFLILFFGRIVSIILLAASNKNTVSIDADLKYGLSLVIGILFLYSIHSVLSYFGMNRAVGLDHFDPKMAQLPFVKKGVFKYTSNAMYAIVFLVIYLPGILYESSAGLLVGLFSHCYIWVHYYCTELPDIRIIYKN